MYVYKPYLVFTAYCNSREEHIVLERCLKSDDLEIMHSGPDSYLWIVERNNGGVVEVVAQVGVEEIAREAEAAENHEGPDHPLLAPENILASSTAA